MKLVIVSDTHCRLRDIKIPSGDLLIHAGDLTFRGNEEEISQEARELNRIKKRFKYGILFVPGNHDWMFETNEKKARELMGDIKVLIDESITIDGINFYGSPWQPAFCDWAFNLSRGEPLKKKWNLIPAATNVLITHGPPQTILDSSPGICYEVGCYDLLQRIKELPNLKLHVMGHVHGGAGILEKDGVTFINASMVSERYKVCNKPIVYELEL